MGVVIVLEWCRDGRIVEGVEGKCLKALLRGFYFDLSEYPIVAYYPKRS